MTEGESENANLSADVFGDKTKHLEYLSQLINRLMLEHVNGNRICLVMRLNDDHPNVNFYKNHEDLAADLIKNGGPEINLTQARAIAPRAKILAQHINIFRCQSALLERL